MASSINSTSAGNGGLVSTGDDSGILNIQTNETTAITVDASQKTSLVNDATISGLTVGKGGGAVSTNTAVGTSALAANTTGSNSTAVGYQTLYSATSVGYQTCVGTQAGYSSTTGGMDAFGYQAGYANTTGAYNTAIGLYSQKANTTGSYNTALGRESLYSNTTASNNTAVGYQAGYAITTQSNNIYIGYSCGSSQTGSGGIFIGANAFSGYNGNNQVAFKTGDGREALYADINAGASFRQYSNSATWAVTSDQRVKENIVEITSGLEKIVFLRPVEFDYITTKEHNIGFVAQEFKNVLPDQVKLVKARPEEAELVGEDEIYTIQQNLVPYLVKAIQELKAINDTQAETINALTARIVAIEEK